MLLAFEFESEFNALSSADCQDESSQDKPGHSSEGLQLYDSHIPTSRMQKVLLTAGSAFMALYDPKRAGEFLDGINNEVAA